MSIEMPESYLTAESEKPVGCKAKINKSLPGGTLVKIAVDCSGCPVRDIIRDFKSNTDVVGAEAELKEVLKGFCQSPSAVKAREVPAAK